MGEAPPPPPRLARTFVRGRPFDEEPQRVPGESGGAAAAAAAAAQGAAGCHKALRAPEVRGPAGGWGGVKRLGFSVLPGLFGLFFPVLGGLSLCLCFVLFVVQVCFWLWGVPHKSDRHL